MNSFSILDCHTAKAASRYQNILYSAIHKFDAWWLIERLYYALKDATDTNDNDRWWLERLQPLIEENKLMRKQWAEKLK